MSHIGYNASVDNKLNSKKKKKKKKMIKMWNVSIPRDDNFRIQDRELPRGKVVLSSCFPFAYDLCVRLIAKIERVEEENVTPLITRTRFIFLPGLDVPNFPQVIATL